MIVHVATSIVVLNADSFAPNLNIDGMARPRTLALLVSRSTSAVSTAGTPSKACVTCATQWEQCMPRTRNWMWLGAPAAPEVATSASNPAAMTAATRAAAKEAGGGRAGWARVPGRERDRPPARTKDSDGKWPHLGWLPCVRDRHPPRGLQRARQHVCLHGF